MKNDNKYLDDTKLEMSEKGRAVADQFISNSSMHPILNHTDESLRLLEQWQSLMRSKSEYIEKFEYTKLDAALRLWLLQLEPQLAKKQAQLVFVLKKSGIFPELDLGGNDFSIGHFRQVDHNGNRAYISTLKKKKKLTECYNSFLFYLDDISIGWFRVRERFHIQMFRHSDGVVNEWAGYAINDFDMAQDLFGVHPLCYAGALFFLNQAVEKMLKAYLIFNGQEINKTHDINGMLKTCLEYDRELDKFKQLIIKINPYCKKSRYPDEKYIIPKSNDMMELIMEIHSFLSHIQTNLLAKLK